MSKAAIMRSSSLSATTSDSHAWNALASHAVKVASPAPSSSMGAWQRAQKLRLGRLASPQLPQRVNLNID
jgi:hypothetical protein